MDRYRAIRGEHREWLIVDTMSNPPRVVCSTSGWNSNPDFICKALNAYSSPIDKIMQDANVTITDVISK